MVLTALLIGLVLAAVGVFIAVIRGLELWRQAKRTGKAITGELGRFEERTARTEQLFADADRASADLREAIARLQASRARLQVLLASIERARRRLRWLQVFLPVR